MFNLTAICRNKQCANHGVKFTKKQKSSTYETTDGQKRIRTNLTCPVCRTWSRIIKLEEVE